MLIDEIKKANVAAMKARDSVAKGIYSIIMNKYLLLSVKKREEQAEVTDAGLVQIITKTIKELEEEKASYEKAGNAQKVNDILHQMEVIKVYLPKMLTEDEIRAELAKLDDKSMPAVMKHFKANFSGKVDMGLVSRIARQ